MNFKDCIYFSLHSFPLQRQQLEQYRLFIGVDNQGPSAHHLLPTILTLLLILRVACLWSGMEKADVALRVRAYRFMDSFLS